MSAPTERWSGFLESVASRHAQVMREAHEGCLGLFEACDGDLGPLTSAWTAMQARAQALESKVEATWHDKVEGLMASAGLDEGAVEEQGSRGQRLVRELEQQREHVRVHLYAQAARRIWARARAEHVASLDCPQCAAPLVPPVTLVSVNLTCAACGAVTTFEPGSRMRSVGSAAIPALLEEATLPEVDALRGAEEALHGAHGEPPALVDALEAAHLAYWTKWLELRATWEGRDLDLQHELTGRMRSFREQWGR